MQQILILLVHALVLLHEGLQLDLRLPGAFQLWLEETQGQVALGPNGQLSHHIMGAGEIRPGPPSGLELPHPLVTDKELDPKEAGHVLKVTEKVLPPRIEHRG